MKFTLTLLLAATLIARDPVRARKAMVVAQEPIATDVGLEILKKGGNAYDAAVAVSFALTVTYPSAGNIGGGGFALVRSASGDTNFIDFREKAPGAASRDMYLDKEGNVTRDSVLGWRAVAVPGTVRGLALLHKKYGKLKWADVVMPAAKLAKNGFVLSYSIARGLQGAQRTLGQFPESKRLYQRDGNYYEAGETLRLPELATTLTRIAKHGPNEFYLGQTAKMFAKQMAQNGGLITEADLRDYKAVERKPLMGKYRGHDIISAPPPSSGGIGMLQMMAMLDHLDYSKSGLGSARHAHTLTEVMRRYYADRSHFLGDPDFVKIPVATLLKPEYIASRAASINPSQATPSNTLQHGPIPPEESPETTHLSVVDAQGNAVSLTYTLNGSYGSGVTVPGLGFLLNNVMDDFSAKPGNPNMFGDVGGEANSIAPGKRMLSCMTPTIVVKDGKLNLVIGAPGGTRIITGVMQVILNVIDFKLNMQDAIDTPRLHHQWLPDKIYLERGWSPDTVEILKRLGHNVETGTPSVSNVHGILVEDKWLQGAPDGRTNGKAAGY